jgi:hypothetical protein
VHGIYSMTWREEPKGEFTLAQEKRERKWAREDARRRARAEQQARTYTAEDLKPFYEVDSATGCWLWTGEFHSYGNGTREIPVEIKMGKHQMCGVSHNAMSRTIYEEYQGSKLKPTENVVGTCASNQGVRHACVNPEHHELRRGAGLMFAHEMIE